MEAITPNESLVVYEKGELFKVTGRRVSYAMRRRKEYKRVVENRERLWTTELTEFPVNTGG